jgi:hypothetical protein
VRLAPKSISFLMGGPSSLARSGGAAPGTGCMVPRHFAAGGNMLYLDYWTVIGDPWYTGYKTPIVAPEPSIERVAGAGRLRDDRIGTHMILWGPRWDLEV